MCVTVPAAAPTADLALTMTDSADPVALGTPFNYVLTAQNLGPQPAVGVQITDTLPAGLTATVASASQGSCTIGTRSVTCNIGTLGVNATATVTITVTGSVSGTLTNTRIDHRGAAGSGPGQQHRQPADHVELTSCSTVTFTGPRPFAGSAGPMAVVRLVDMNHDGRLDAVATHETNPGGIDVFLNDGAGGFAAPRFTSTPAPWIHVVADFNGDTHPDVITASESNTPVHSISLRLLTNDGTGTLTLVPGFSLPFEGTLTAVDIDRDGDQDLAIVIGDDLISAATTGRRTSAPPKPSSPAWPDGPRSATSTATTARMWRWESGRRALPSPWRTPAAASSRRSFTPSPAVRTAWPILPTSTATAASTSSPSRETTNGPAPGASVLFGDGAGGFGGAVQATTTSCTCRR